VNDIRCFNEWYSLFQWARSGRQLVWETARSRLTTHCNTTHCNTTHCNTTLCACVRSKMEKSHSCWPRTVWCEVNMFYKNGMRPLMIPNGTKCYSILYCNSQWLYIRLKYMYSVISVIVDSLPGNTKKQGIDKFVAFGVRLVHSWAVLGCTGNLTQKNNKDGHLPWIEGRKRAQLQCLGICTGLVAPRGQHLGENQRRTAWWARHRKDTANDHLVQTCLYTTFSRGPNLLKRTSAKMSL